MAVASLVVGLASVSVIALPAHEAGAGTNVVTNVTLGGDPTAPTVTVRGSGFGTESDLGAAIPAYCSETGSDYADNFYFTDLSGGWAAGQGSGPFGDCTGVFITSYSDNQITFGFGNGYSVFGAVASGDHFSMTVLGTTFTGTALFPVETAYVIDSGAVTPVNMATDTTGAQISFGGGSQPAGIAITPDGATAWVADQFLGAVDPITTATNTPGTPITIGGEPSGIAITPNGATAYVSNQNGTVDPVDLATRTAGTPITVGGASFSAIAITPDGSTAYVADQNNGVVDPIDLATATVGPSISVGSAFAGPDAIAITPNGATAYVVNNQDGTVVPIDTATDTPGTPISAVGYGAQYIAITPDGTTAYVSNNQTIPVSTCCEDAVTPIDTATNTVGTPIVVVGIGSGGGGGSGSIAVTPDGTTAWAGGSANTMAPIVSITATNSSLSPCLESCGLITFTPDQGPSASLSASTAAGTTTLDASASVAGSSPIVSYSWDFGDGSPVTTTSTATTTHVYGTPGAYTPTVTETDAAGTSTSQVFTGQTASLNGSSAAVASASVVIVNQDCEANFTCTATLETPSTPTSPAQSVTVTASTPSGASEVLSVTSGPGKLKCSNTGFHQVGNVTSYAATFTPTGNVKVTDLIVGATSTAGVKVCFAGTSPPHVYLAPCSLSPPPCISNLSVVAGGVKAALKIPAADPRYRIEGLTTAVESPTGLPATAAIGSKIAITGTGLLGPDGKTVPSVGFSSVTGSMIRATIGVASATKIKVKVPNGAASGVVTLIWPQVTATAKITIT